MKDKGKIERGIPLPEPIREMCRGIPPYTGPEMQAALEFYAFIGHLRNACLSEQLRNGELSRKVGVLTGGVASDVYKICEML